MFSTLEMGSLQCVRSCCMLTHGVCVFAHLTGILVFHKHTSACMCRHRACAWCWMLRWEICGLHCCSTRQCLCSRCMGLCSSCPSCPEVGCFLLHTRAVKSTENGEFNENERLNAKSNENCLFASNTCMACVMIVLPTAFRPLLLVSWSYGQHSWTGVAHSTVLYVDERR